MAFTYRLPATLNNCLQGWLLSSSYHHHHHLIIIIIITAFEAYYHHHHHYHHRHIIIYIIISENIRYLLWNRGRWRSLNNTYPIFPTPCIRCTNHLCDSCDLTDVNPHFIPSLLWMIQNVDLLWRHRYKSRSPAIVTSQWPILPPWLLWTLS